MVAKNGDARSVDSMEGLTSRIEEMIEELIGRIHAMDEAPDICASYTVLIGNLYSLSNTTKRMVEKEPENSEFFSEVERILGELDVKLASNKKDAEAKSSE